VLIQKDLTRELAFNNFKKLLILSTCLLLLGCKSKKKFQNPGGPELSKERILRLFEDRPDFDFFDGKAKIRIKTSNSSDRATLYFRSKRDSVLWMVGKRLSVEGGRVQLDTTTATFLNRLDKTYQVISLEKLQDTYGITADFSYIQDMFHGITPEVDTTELWEVTRDSLHWKIKSMAQSVLHSFHLDPYTGDVVGGEFRSKYGYDGAWTYGDYRQVADCCRIPFHRNYKMNVSDEDYLSIEIQFSEITLDEPKQIKFSIPTRYTRIQ